MRNPENHFFRRLFRWWGVAGALFGGILFAAAVTAAEAPRFNRDIRPILSENCFPCHGPDSAARKADLRLDLRDQALEAKAIVPWNPGDSKAIDRIFTTRAGRLMPPPKSRKTLTDAQKDLIRKWVAAGAEYEPHWSFIAPVRPEPPEVKDTSWVRNPIDRYILKKLEEKGLRPAPEADRRTLARRLSLDLTGLPPASDDVEAYVRDGSPNADEAYIDRLLGRPSWGEHRGRYWLDLARYADTHGIHFDNLREMWSYRDWVIDAFNRNLPFDRFTIEQLAGDLLEKPTLDQRVASGFNRCNMTTNEGGAISEEYLVLYTRDRTETTSQVWLGLTAGCAVCHNHKFDPLTQKEFYEMAAFFNNTTQNAMDGNIKDTPPVLPLPRSEDRDRWDAIQGDIAAAARDVEEHRKSAKAGFREKVNAAGAAAFASVIPVDGLRKHLPLDDGKGDDGKGPDSKGADGHVSAKAFANGPGVAFEVPDAGDFEKDQPFSCAVWAKAPSNDVSGSLVARMDDEHGHRGWDIWFERGRVAAHLVNDWPNKALKASSKVKVESGRWFHVLLTYDGSGKAAGVKLYLNGAVRDMQGDVDKLEGTMRTAVPLRLGQRQKGSRIENLQLQDLRLYGRALSADEARGLARGTRGAWLASKPAESRSAAEEDELYGAWLSLVDGRYRELESKTAQLESELAALRTRGTAAHVMQERAEMPEAFILFRGEYDRRKDKVNADTPDVLPPLPKDFPRNRLGFARWLLQPENPLTARVTVNRFWQEVFGTGIVRSAGDFGATGELPSHPELLDWLAVEFRETGWDVKRLFKLLVNSAAYRQSAETTPEKLEKDSQNRLFSRGPRFRMDAEMIRDYALASSGLLVRKIGGPSVKPYQADGVWEAVAMMESNTRYYKRDAGESLYRRSLYTFWKRAAPPASMDVLNAPSREFCVVRRERTNTPLQALVTLNDVQFFEAARNLAQRALKETAPGDETRIDYLARRLVARPFRADELEVALETLRDLRAHYRAHPEDAKQTLLVGESKADPKLDPAELAALSLLTNQLMNLDEVLNK